MYKGLKYYIKQHTKDLPTYTPVSDINYKGESLNWFSCLGLVNLVPASAVTPRGRNMYSRLKGG